MDTINHTNRTLSPGQRAVKVLSALKSLNRLSRWDFEFFLHAEIEIIEFTISMLKHQVLCCHGAGRFGGKGISHLYYLIHDIPRHVTYSSYNIFKLETV